MITFQLHYNQNDDFYFKTSFDTVVNLLRTIINQYFTESSTISKEDFIQLIDQQNCDLIYLYKILFDSNRPFTENELTFTS